MSELHGVETLAWDKTFKRAVNFGIDDFRMGRRSNDGLAHDLAEAILASYWLAELKATVAAKALREAASNDAFVSLGAAIHEFRCTNPDCRHYDDRTYFTPRDNDAASACAHWLRARAAVTTPEATSGEGGYRCGGSNCPGASCSAPAEGEGR